MDGTDKGQILESKKVRFPFAIKLALVISLLAVLSTGSSAYYIFQQTRELVVQQMGNRLKDIGRAGSYLFDGKARKDLKYLVRQVKLHSNFSENKKQFAVLNGEDGEALTDDDGTYESMRASISKRIMAGPEFQNVVQILRKIREGTREETRPLQSKIPALHVIRKTSEDVPTLEYIYMLLPVSGFPPAKYVLYLADSDYLPVDDDGTGEPYEGNPIGNITNTLTPEMYMGFSGKAISEKDFTEDQWGDVVISGYVPILDSNRRVISVLGMDYNVVSEANQIADLGKIILTIVISVFFLSVLLSVFLAGWFNRPIAVLQEGAKQVAEGNFSARVNVKSKDELGSLAYAFNKMVSEIENYAQNLKSLNVAFKRFVPQEFFQHMGKTNIMDVRLGDQTERLMTVLFSDIRSFTALSETMSPKENFDFLNSYLKRVSPLIRSYDGFIDKFIGDSIMALFPENPSSAIQSSIQILHSLQQFNNERKAKGLSPIHIGTGLHTGRLMLGTIGEEQRMESTVISDTVNQASRLESLTKRFGVNIIVSKETMDQAKDVNVLYRSLGRVRVKGKRGALEIMEIYSGDSEEQINLKQKTLNLFKEGLEHYQVAQLDSALKVFSEILNVNPQDTAARVYYEHCQKNW